MDKWYMKTGTDSDAVLSSRVRLFRNLPEIPFPWRMDKRQCKAVEEKVCAAAFDENSMLSGEFRFIDMEKVNDLEAVSLAERCLADADFVSTSTGRGLLLNNDESVAVMVNGQNHVTMQAMSTGSDLFSAYEAADTVDTVLNKSLHFAFDEELGYITPNPIHVGTGMEASLLLHLPALTDIGATLRISSNLSKIGLSLNGIYGSAAKPRGALYRLSNCVTLGLSEQVILSNLRSMAKQVISREREARKELASDIKVQDTVFRSLGILKSARFMTNDEFFDFISVLRFGIETGLIKDISYECINSLMFKVQPATLTLAAGKPLTADERSATRAGIVRDELK